MTPAGVETVRVDLANEQASLAVVVASMSRDAWTLPTASAGWTIADQLGHLAFFDTAAESSIVNPDDFVVHRSELLAGVDGIRDPDDNVTLGDYRRMSPGELLTEWLSATDRLRVAADGLNDTDRLSWYGPSMGAKTFLTARLMETWARGHDIVGALHAAGVPAISPATERLRHIAYLGYATRRWTYVNRGLEPPDGDVRVELRSPAGESWTFGDQKSPDRIIGAAVDFCLVVAQRRHVDDTGLVVTGPLAYDWMRRAQVFAGPPTDGPPATGRGSLRRAR